MRKFLLLLFGWSLAMGAFIYLTFQLKQPSTAFMGLVQSEKTVIRSPEAGEIQLLKVNPGDSVMPGDTLLVLFRPEVERQQQESQFQLQKLGNESRRQAQEIQADMQRVRMAWAIALQELKQERRLWEIRQKRDQELASPWLAEASTPEQVDSLALLKQAEFETRKQAIEQEYSLRLKALEGRLRLTQPILQSNQDLAKNELAYWEAISNQQVIRAPHAGWVGEVMVNSTEVTLKGTPLVEIWGHEARYVAGFIHENFTAALQAGQQVNLSSANNSEHQANATIVKLGNRIVEFPARLRKAPEVRLYGRETIIRLEANNPFLIGEKVLIQVQ